MKLYSENKNIAKHGSNHIETTAREESIPLIMDILRKQIYSNPIKTIVREICSNAIDAHKRNNNSTLPIEVNLTTTLFQVIDHGSSMTPEYIEEVYAPLGNSDKRHDNSAIGGFGIGSASPLSYCDIFHIFTRTREDDSLIERKYAYYISDENKSIISLISEKCISSELGTGTIVEIPVKDDDYSKFKDYIIFYSLFMNIKSEVLSKKKLSRELGSDKKWYLSNVGVFDPIESGLYCKLDCVPYLVSEEIESLLHNLAERQLIKRIFGLIQNGFLLELDIPIGDLDLNASREELRYTDSTLEVIIEKCKEFEREIKYFIFKYLNECHTLHQAYSYYDNLVGSLKIYALDVPFFEDVTINELNSIGTGGENSFKYYYKRYKNYKYVTEKSISHKVNFAENAVFLIPDVERKNYTRYANKILNGVDTVYLVEEEWIESHRLRKHFVVFRVSDLINSEKKENRTRIRERNTTTFEVYNLCRRQINNRCKGITKCCNKVDVYRNVQEPHYYILMNDDFEIQFDSGPIFGEYNWDKISRLKDILNIDELYLIKPKDKNKPGQGWRNLKTIYNCKVENLNYTEEENELFCREYSLLTYLKCCNRVFKGFIFDEHFQHLKEGVFRRYLVKLVGYEMRYEEQYNRLELLKYKYKTLYNWNHINSDVTRWEEANLKFLNEHELGKLYTEIINAFPLLSLIVEKQEDIEEVKDYNYIWWINYINVMQVVLEKQFQKDLT